MLVICTTLSPSRLGATIKSRRFWRRRSPLTRKDPRPVEKAIPQVRIWTLASLRAATFKAPEPIVEDIIAEGETVGFIGKPRAGKSRFAQQMALAVASGQGFLGHAIPRARRVLCLDLENRPAGVRARFQKMSRPSAADEQLLI
jgi:hypothetical protein